MQPILKAAIVIQMNLSSTSGLSLAVVVVAFADL